jgi:cystathionine beta-lyase/cystathionine gamma-synthase
VSYPGLPHHKGHDVLKRLLNPGYGYGGLIGVDMGSAAKGEAVSGFWGKGASGGGADCSIERDSQQQSERQ